ncbi:hypothetical protein LSAT2_018476 [Lamellibrachia satsuma]|nr:hypothetical protein LSAT2_018476 [Lamellibrachia satsuma]
MLHDGSTYKCCWHTSQRRVNNLGDDYTVPEVTREGTARLGVLQSRLLVGVVGRDALISEVPRARFRFDRSLLRL